VPISSLLVCGCFYFKKMGKREWVGLKFDMLTVLEELPGNKIKTRCDCGNEKIASKSLFYSKCRKTCGCHVASVVAGVEYGCLTVLEELVASPIGKEDIKHCRVKCRCGNIKDVNRSRVFIGILKTCGCASKRSANVDHHIFKNKNSESLYWAGFIAADGNICNSYLNIGLMESDINHLIKFKEWIKADTKVRLKAKTKSCYFAIKNPVMCEDILKYGIYPRKSLTYDPPLFCEQSVDFWRGMIDGDGHVCCD